MLCSGRVVQQNYITWLEQRKEALEWVEQQWQLARQGKGILAELSELLSELLEATAQVARTLKQPATFNTDAKEVPDGIKSIINRVPGIHRAEPPHTELVLLLQLLGCL